MPVTVSKRHKVISFIGRLYIEMKNCIIKNSRQDSIDSTSHLEQGYILYLYKHLNKVSIPYLTIIPAVYTMYILI